jgi:hypothetical protein
LGRFLGHPASPRPLSRDTALVALKQDGDRASARDYPRNRNRRGSLLGARRKEANMGRGILLWLLGVPIPIIILLALFWH